MSKLIATIGEYNATPAQIAALKWLQASTGIERYVRFTQMWRQGIQGGKTLELSDCWKWYSEKPHQAEALRWFEQSTGAPVVNEFLRMWRLATGKAIYLSVPFFSQLDNLYEPQRTCNTSACAMAAKYLGAKVLGDDDYYARFVKGKFDTTDHNGHTRALMQLGIKSQWHTDLGFDDLDRELERQKPVVIGILHRGSLVEPRGGHIVVCIGRDESGNRYIFHDSYGSLLDGYTSAVVNGRGVAYSKELLKARWLVGHPNGGWGRLFR